MMRRNLIEIDEDKCDGCGLCVPACQEGALRIVDGKARIVSESICDGLGACLGHCPRGAISIVHREAPPFDERAARQHLSECSATRADARSPAGGPGAAARSLPVLTTQPASPCAVSGSRAATHASGQAVPLSNWPVQLHLVPPLAPYLREADLLLVADCVPLACADFHARFMDGRPVLVGCPKLDDAAAYERKLAHIVAAADVRSVQVVRMEVPCCAALGRVARCAAAQARSAVPVREMEVSVRGQVTPVGACPGG